MNEELIIGAMWIAVVTGVILVIAEIEADFSCRWRGHDWWKERCVRCGDKRS